MVDCGFTYRRPTGGADYVVYDCRGIPSYERFEEIHYAIVYAICVDVVYGAIQMLVVICVPFIMNYNGKRGTWKGMKWFFYAYYVGHLVLCGIIRIVLHGNVGVIIGG